MTNHDDSDWIDAKPADRIRITAAEFIAIGAPPDEDRALSELELAPYLELQAKPLPLPESLDTPHGEALTRAVNRAVSELEGQGEKSNRIALQLLLALARYEAALGNDAVASQLLDEMAPAPACNCGGHK